MTIKKLTEIAEGYLNGNISDTRTALKRMKIERDRYGDCMLTLSDGRVVTIGERVIGAGSDNGKWYLQIRLDGVKLDKI